MSENDSQKACLQIDRITLELGKLYARGNVKMPETIDFYNKEVIVKIGKMQNDNLFIVKMNEIFAEQTMFLEQDLNFSRYFRG